MLLKSKILEILSNLTPRHFKVSLMSKQILQLKQYHSGGDDFCPLVGSESLTGQIGNNPKYGVVFAWCDDIEKKSEPGEKRIYSVKKDLTTSGIEVVAEVHLKNDGNIEINGNKDINIIVNGNAQIKSTGKTTIEASEVNLGGSGGAKVLTENSTIKDGDGVVCSITANTTKTKAL